MVWSSAARLGTLPVHGSALTTRNRGVPTLAWPILDCYQATNPWIIGASVHGLSNGNALDFGRIAPKEWYVGNSSMVARP